MKAALAHPKADGLSDEKIAKHVGVSRQTVFQYRHEIRPTCKNLTSQPRTGADGRTINVANIGKRAGAKPELPATQKAKLSAVQRDMLRP